MHLTPGMPDDENKQDKQMPRKDQDLGNREDKQVGNQNLPDDDEEAITQRNPRMPKEDFGKQDFGKQDKDDEDKLDEDVIERE